MAFMVIKVFDLQGIIFLVLSIISLVAATNIDCGGKPFHCINSTHFMICVDLGGGVSSTVDNYVIPCPPTTECQGTNRFECEFIPTTPKLDVITTNGENSEISATTSIPEVLTTEISKTTYVKPFEDNLNTHSSTTVSGNEVVQLTTLENGLISSNQIEIQENNKLETVSTSAKNGLDISTISDTIAIDVNVSKEPISLLFDQNSDIIAIVNTTQINDDGTNPITENLPIEPNNDVITTEALQITTSSPIAIVTATIEPKSSTTDVITTNADVYSVPHTENTLEYVDHATNNDIPMTSTESILNVKATGITTELPANEIVSDNSLTIVSEQLTTKYKAIDIYTTTEKYYDTITTDNLFKNDLTVRTDDVFETSTTKSEFIYNNDITETGLGFTVGSSNLTATAYNTVSQTKTVQTAQQFYETTTTILNPITDKTNILDLFTITSLPNAGIERFEEISPENEAVTTNDAITYIPSMVDMNLIKYIEPITSNTGIEHFEEISPENEAVATNEAITSMPSKVDINVIKENETIAPNTGIEHFEEIRLEAEVVTTNDAIISIPSMVDMNHINDKEITSNDTETAGVIYTAKSNIANDTTTFYNKYADSTTESLFPRPKENVEVNLKVTKIIEDTSTLLTKTEEKTSIDPLIQYTSETLFTAEPPPDFSQIMNTPLSISNSKTLKNELTTPLTTNTAINNGTELTSTDIINKHVEFPKTFIVATLDSSSIDVTTKNAFIFSGPEKTSSTLQNSSLNINTNTVSDFSNTRDYFVEVITDSSKKDFNKQDNVTPSLLPSSTLQDMMTKSPVEQGDNFSNNSKDGTTQLNKMGNELLFKQTETAIPRKVTIQENHEKKNLTTNESLSAVTDDSITTTASLSEAQSRHVNTLDSSLLKNKLKIYENILIQSGQLSELVLTTVTAPNIIDPTYLSTPTTKRPQVIFHKPIPSAKARGAENDAENRVPILLNEENSAVLNSSSQIDSLTNMDSNQLNNENTKLNSVVNITDQEKNPSHYSSVIRNALTILPSSKIDTISSTMSPLMNVKDEDIQKSVNEITLPNNANTLKVNNTNIRSNVSTISDLNNENGTLSQPSTTDLVGGLTYPILNIEHNSSTTPTITKLDEAEIIQKKSNNGVQINYQTRINQSQYISKDNPSMESRTNLGTLRLEIVDHQRTSNLSSFADHSDTPVTIEQYTTFMTDSPLDVEEGISLPVEPLVLRSDRDTATSQQSDLNVNITATTAVILNEETSQNGFLNTVLNSSMTTESSIEKLNELSEMTNNPNFVLNNNNDANKKISNKDSMLLPTSNIEDNSANRNNTAVENLQSEENITDAKGTRITQPILKVNFTEIGTKENLYETLNSTNIDIHETVGHVNKSHYNCMNHSRGRYADKDDCRKFYICIGRLQPIVGTCPINTVFSELRKQCTKNLSQCTRNNQFVCAAEGRFGDFLQDNIYYVCVRNSSNKNSSTNNNYIRYKLQCQDGLYLNQTTVKCVPRADVFGSDVSSQSLASISDNTNSYSSSSSQSVTMRSQELKNPSKTKFKCEDEGKFQDPNDCRKYYICYKNKKSVLKRKRKECDSDEVFDDETKKCKDSESYECLSSH